MTPYTQAQVDEQLEYARQRAAGQAAQADPRAGLTLRRHQGHMGAFLVLLASLALWAFAIWCSVTGWGPAFLLGFCFLTAFVVLIGRWRARKLL